jgi:hypothetical protein
MDHSLNQISAMMRIHRLVLSKNTENRSLNFKGQGVDKMGIDFQHHNWPLCYALPIRGYASSSIRVVQELGGELGYRAETLLPFLQDGLLSFAIERVEVPSHSVHFYHPLCDPFQVTGP